MQKVLIYKIECLENGKVYIGQTKNLRKRWDEHKYELRKGVHHSTHMQRAWTKFGEENFKFSVIEECSTENADTSEKKWISFYDSANKLKGFNLDLGGGTCKELSEESKIKIGIKNKINYHAGVKDLLNSPEAIEKRSKSNTGKKRNEEFRKKMSVIASEKTGSKNSFYGRKHTDEYKKKSSERFKGRARRPHKPLIAINIKTNEILTFSSRIEAEKHGFNRTGICEVLRGKWSSYKGYSFKEP
jgi:group I intron endonuclease